MKRGLLSAVSDTVNAAITKAQAAAESATKMVINRDAKHVADMAAMQAALDETAEQLRAEMAEAPQAPGTPASPGIQIEYRDGIPVPAMVNILGSSSVDVAVTWPTPFPDETYLVRPQVASSAAGLIGKTGAITRSKTSTGCIITVTTTAVLSAGNATLSAVAYRKE